MNLFWSWKMTFLICCWVSFGGVLLRSLHLHSLVTMANQFLFLLCIVCGITLKLAWENETVVVSLSFIFMYFLNSLRNFGISSWKFEWFAQWGLFKDILLLLEFNFLLMVNLGWFVVSHEIGHNDRPWRSLLGKLGLSVPMMTHTEKIRSWRVRTGKLQHLFHCRLTQGQKTLVGHNRVCLVLGRTAMEEGGKACMYCHARDRPVLVRPAEAEGSGSLASPGLIKPRVPYHKSLTPLCHGWPHQTWLIYGMAGHVSCALLLPWLFFPGQDRPYPGHEVWSSFG